MIGDCHTAALIDRHGSIDWYCPDRFDAPFFFAACSTGKRAGICGLRRLECLSGDVELNVEFKPTFDFARARTQVTCVSGTGALA